MAIDYVNREGLEYFHSKLKTYLSTKYATKEELEAAIANFGGFQVVSLNQQGKPDVAEPSTKIIYLTKEADSSKTDPYTEWICTNTTGPVWEIIGETTPEINEMIGATASTAGTAGLVPAPAAGDQDKFLKGDGTWGVVSGGSTARVSYNAQTEELSLDFSPEPLDSVLIGGRWYPYVQIGNQIWLAENLDYKFDGCDIGSSGTPSTATAWYYNNDETTYGWEGKKYGLLYNWYAAKYLEDNKDNLLPSGWHVPSTTDWDTLINTVGASNAGTILKSITDWTRGAGTDNLGFTAFPAGTYNGSFRYLGTRSYFWTPNESDSSNAYIRRLGTEASWYSGNYGKTNGSSIRLVKDVT